MLVLPDRLFLGYHSQHFNIRKVQKHTSYEKSELANILEQGTYESFSTNEGGRKFTMRDAEQASVQLPKEATKTCHVYRRI